MKKLIFELHYYQVTLSTRRPKMFARAEDEAYDILIGSDNTLVYRFKTLEEAWSKEDELKADNQICWTNQVFFEKSADDMREEDYDYIVGRYTMENAR